MEFFNGVILANPITAAIAGLAMFAMTIGTVVNVLNQLNENQLKDAQNSIDEANKNQEEIDKKIELITKIEELNEKYKQGEISRAELRQEGDKLIEQYGLEEKTLDELISKHQGLANAIKEERTAAAEEGYDSAKEEIEAAASRIEHTRTLNGRKGIGHYDVELSREKSNEEVQRILEESGMENISNGTVPLYAFRASGKDANSANSIVALYDQISKASE